MSRYPSKEEQMEKSNSFRDVRGVCDITENGYGGFTMDSVYQDELRGEKWVTSVFRLSSEMEAERKAREEGKWKPENFNFKAAIDGTPSRSNSKMKEVPEKVKEAHYLKKAGSRKNKKRASQVKKQSNETSEDIHSDIWEEVSKKIEEGGFEKLEECLKEKHGADCKCGEYVKEMADYYGSQGISLFDASTGRTQKNEGQKDETPGVVKEGISTKFDYEGYTEKVGEFYNSLSADAFVFPDIQYHKNKQACDIEQGQEED